MPKPTAAHFQAIVTAFADGQVVPFLGAGANLCGRPTGKGWEPGKYLPSGGELSTHLADHFKYESSEPDVECPKCKSAIQFSAIREKQDLVRVSQFVALNAGSGPLYEQLRIVFNEDYPPTSLHNFFAKLPDELRSRKLPNNTLFYRRRLLILTTNYDDVLERAFQSVNQEFHVITYMADMVEEAQRGKCLHLAPGGNPELIASLNDYRGLTNDEFPIIVKIHGAIDRGNEERDSFVITEDHYIDYLTRADISKLLPYPLPAILKKSSFLFLGYSLRDMNLRVILQLIQREQKLNFQSWAVQLNPQDLDQKFWRRYDVEILDVSLEHYIDELNNRVAALPGVNP